MKKTISLTLLCFILVLNISCESDDNGDGDKPKITGSLSVEEGKNQLEDNSIELLNKIDAFKNNDALNEIIELAEFLNGSNDSKIVNFKKTAFSTINNISSIEASNKSITTFNAKQSIAIISETPLADDFQAEKGIYLWNSDTEKFDKTGSSDDVIYNINYNGKVAVFSFTDFTTKLAGSEGSKEEIPTLIKANLKIDNTTVFTQAFSASFKDNQLIPSTINNTTTIGGFAFVTDYSNSSNKTITQSFDFKIDGDVIIGYSYTAKGKFNNEDGNIEDIIDSVTLSFQFLDANLYITANDNNFNSDSELSIDQEVALLNSNVNSELSINKKSIAKSIFYKDESTYTDYVFNSSTQNFELVEVSEDVVNIKFLFDDGTSNDFNTYIEGSFTELESRFDAVFEAYEKLFEDM
ncbi:hypothetical protein QLS71_007540 [Mariniflexile litorale]|uniref:Uncharacterized protein n=1 Tax=Mariniflexile litorale TaxID=3045158 RepID=A0AAU7EJT4_9FLAO|nr:hypothetical protein [Mariniflexile sp. KMM 9835]MDQ8211199.1 hypothetical protein [Mariniflexile sp. KMM 9835]